MEQAASVNSKTRIGLSRVPRRIAARTGQPAPAYRRLWLAAVDGRIPAEVGENGRWTVAEADLDAIAAAFGLAPRASAAAAAA